MRWSAVLLAVALVLPAVAAAQDNADEIVVVGQRELLVIGHRLKKVHLRYQLNGPYLRDCTIEESSGDRRADDTACQLLGRCVKLGYRDEAPAQHCMERSIDIFVDRARRRTEASAIR